MGKGTIIAHLGAGQYTVTVNRERARVTAAIAALTARIAKLDTRLAGMAAGKEKSWVSLQKAALETRLSLLQDHTNDPTVTAWCADLTTDLSGVVGTLEIPGERGTVQVRPGYMGAATYSATRDGQLQEAIASTPAGVFYNWALLPGWQKWKPTVRWGVLSDLDIDHHTCTVTLDAAVSSAQGLDINQSTVLSSVPIEYMDCNGAAFSNGDNVLVEFNNQDFNDPVVIGFKDNPAPCEAGEYVVVHSSDWAIVWDVVACKVAAISGVSFPCLRTDPAYTAWLANSIEVGEALYTYSYQGQHQDSTLVVFDCDADPTPCTCRECTTTTTIDPDPSASDQRTALPYIDETGAEVENYGWYYARYCADDYGCPESYDMLPAIDERLTRLAVYRTIYPGSRLPQSLKLTIQNDHGGKTAFRIQREDYIDWVQDFIAGTQEYKQTLTYKTFCPLGEMSEVEEEYVNTVWGYLPPGAQSQKMLYYSGPSFYAQYSESTLVQIFENDTQTMFRSRSSYLLDWGAEVWSDKEMNIVASCRACDGENTDPRAEARNTAFENACRALRKYAITQGNDGGVVLDGIYQHFES